MFLPFDIFQLAEFLLVLAVLAVFLLLPRKEIRSAFLRLRKECRHKREMKALHERQCRMIIDLSHGLQTPLAVLKGKIERLERNTLHDGQMAGLSQSVDAVAGFVNDLLSFTHFEQSLVTDEKRIFSLTELVRNAANEAAVIAESQNIQTVCDAEPGILIFGNEKRLNEALMNLVSNAVKYMGSGTIRRIRISLETKGRQVLLAVTDTGMGMPEKELPRIFERFYRGSNRTYGEISGTGLGLSIVERIVKEHGGAITVTSEIGKGSTFTLILPFAKQGRLRTNLS